MRLKRNLGDPLSGVEGERVYHPGGMFYHHPPDPSLMVGGGGREIVEHIVDLGKCSLGVHLGDIADPPIHEQSYRRPFVAAVTTNHFGGYGDGSPAGIVARSLGMDHPLSKTVDHLSTRYEPRPDPDEILYGGPRRDRPRFRPDTYEGVVFVADHMRYDDPGEVAKAGLARAMAEGAGTVVMPLYHTGPAFKDKQTTLEERVENMFSGIREFVEKEGKEGDNLPNICIIVYENRGLYEIAKGNIDEIASQVE